MTDQRIFRSTLRLRTLALLGTAVLAPDFAGAQT